MKLPVESTRFNFVSIYFFHALTELLLCSQIPMPIIMITAKIPTTPSMISRLVPDDRAGNEYFKITAASILVRIPTKAPALNPD